MDDYNSQVAAGLAEAWKTQHDCRAKDPGFQVGDRVFVFMPGEKLGKAHRLARPFKGPYRIVAMYDNGAEVKLIDKPRNPTIRVALNRVRWCPSEIQDTEPPVLVGTSAGGAQPAKTDHSPSPEKPSPALEGP